LPNKNIISAIFWNIWSLKASHTNGELLSIRNKLNDLLSTRNKISNFVSTRIKVNDLASIRNKVIYID